MSDLPISVMHFSNEFVRGGAEEHMLTLLRGLDRNYFRPHLVCAPELAEKLQPDLPADVEVVPLRLQKLSHVAAANRLAQVLRQRQVDILHSHLFTASLFASPIGGLCRVPVIVETPHVREQWRHGWLKGSFVVDRLVGRFVDYYIAVSEANARYLAQQKGLPAGKIVVIHNGCDLSRFEPGRQPSPSLKQNLGFNQGDPVLLVTARLEPQKGHGVLLNALSAVRREFPSVRLVCVGEGSLRGVLEREARALGLEDAVRFVGYQPNVPDWLALADVTVLPSFYEGLPLVAIESLAAAKPMVATAVDGTPEVVVDGQTGLVVPPGDVERLAHALCRMLADPELRKKFGRAGRQWVLDRFSQEQQVRKTQEFYLRVVEERRRPEKNPQMTQISQNEERSLRNRRDLRKTAMRTKMQPVSPASNQAHESAAPSALKSAICEETARLGANEYARELRAIVLTGSMARDEATFIEEKGEWKLLGDAEFLLVFHERAALPSGSAINSFEQKIEDATAGRGITCHIALSAVHPRYLRKLAPNIFAYELRTCGQVVWGEAQILSLIPALSRFDIPLEDGWRLLANRIVEFLEVAGQLVDHPAALLPDVHYRTIKFYLDMATSFLLFGGVYAPSYRERAEKLRTLVESTSAKNGYPLFPVRSFSERVRSCTEFKLQKTGSNGSPTAEEIAASTVCWEELVTDARLFWRWELARLTGAQGELSDRELFRKWMQLQPMGKRLRGWAYVLRKCGWHRSWRKWPRWIRRGWRASPRYWVYAAASELFFQVPGFVRRASQRPETDTNWEELQSWLPVASQSKRGSGGSSWEQVASEIAWNYHEFLEATRA